MQIRLPFRLPQLRWPLRLAAALLLLAGLAAFTFWQATSDLPDEAALAAFAPAVPSTVRDGQGNIIAVYSRERRIFLPYAEIPATMVQAFISAEDKTFFSHGGLDWQGIAAAIITNVEGWFGGQRPVGASTITQQVAKSLIGNEVTLWRKLREAILARRLEAVFSKEQILELYLNQIYLGRNAYGVEAAAQAWFGVPAQQLQLPQIAYLAILPKAPSSYNPATDPARVLARRAYVLGQMQANGYISAQQRAEADAAPIGVVPSRSISRGRGDDFIEEVRRQLVARYGDSSGPNSVYGGGLWIRTSEDLVMQRAAETAMRDGMVRYESNQPWRGPAAHIDAGPGWPARLAGTSIMLGYPHWQKAVVLQKRGADSVIGFADGRTASLPGSSAVRPWRGNANRSAGQILKRGDVVPVVRAGDHYALRQAPEISGGMVAEEVASGRVLAMVGGFDARAQAFNRATQAQRQPGSAFKPLVYASALDNGFTPSSIVVDAPYCIFQNKTLGQKCFRNFENARPAGPRTLRWGLEQSRNLITVRVADSIGMDKVTDTARRLGVGNYIDVLAISLGAGETTVQKLTNAYAQMFGQGRQLTPSLIDYVQDRQGRVIWRRDTRACPGCNTPDWNGGPMPRPQGAPAQVMDPRTAYQIVHMMEGVVQRGTATALRSLDRPLAGKTGTTSGPTDVWFVGGTPDVVAGLYMGYDTPRNLGSYAQGGTIAAPMWRQFAEKALANADKTPFLIPPGVRMIRVERRTGKRVFGVWPDDAWLSPVIWEAFKPDNEPRRLGRVEALLAAQGQAKTDAAFLQQAGGIY